MSAECVTLAEIGLGGLGGLSQSTEDFLCGATKFFWIIQTFSSGALNGIGLGGVS
jgi:hypothetical protein